MQPKRIRGTQPSHVVLEGQTMWEIAQLYGIKLSKLYKKNLMVFDRQAKPGETIYLRKKRDISPKTYSYSDVLDEKNKIQAQIEQELQVQIQMEKKAREDAIKLKKEAELAKRQAEEVQKELDELEERKNAAEFLEQEAQKQKEQFDAEQHPPIEPIIVIEKADPEELEMDKPFDTAAVKTYTVKVGDTLYSLSNKFYITIEQLKELNNLKDNNLRVGQVLVVSL